ncbi:hypothetical protein FOC4_g10006698 [Fusarium odoratissimum]|uniref:Uncharacterized protein n=1 Tax=Fusarium oxysporum f. sp. cubense (strain race 4) TaxID=2502994 RepID=N1RI92_FUSC4|nr:hypothetical protein FOC4_g10006698 [Fusarium odoratissimum]
MPEVPWPKSRRVQDANGWGNHDVLEHDQTPFLLDDETRALYERATTGQSSLSDADRQKLSQWPSQEAQDSHYRKQCGLTRSELIAKAVQDPGSLSYFEASLIITPAMDPGLGLQRHRMSKSELCLLDTVLEAVLTKEEIAARQISLDMKGFWDQQSRNAKETLRDNDRQIIEEAMTIQWQGYIMDLDWPVFKEQMETAIRHGFNFMPKVKTAIKDRFAIHETKYDDSKSLQSRFTAMQDERAIPKGLQSNAFLYVDDKTLQSRHSVRPFVWLWELDATGYVIGKGRTWPWRNTSDLEQLHAEAGPSRNSDGERDRTWPPTPRQFQIQSSGSFDNELRIECVATC